MIRPRGNLVLVDILPVDEQREGKIFLPENHQFLAHAIVIDVGAGLNQMGGSDSPTADLKAGQTVLLIAKQPRPPRVAGGGPALGDTGTPILQDGKRYFLVEEGVILGIVSDAGPKLAE